MTERINTLLHWIVEGEHKALRAPLEEKALEDIRAQIQREDMPLSRRAARRLRLLLENERVHVREDERIPGIRTIPEFPDIYAEGEKECIFAGHFIHEQGRVCNISSDYEGVLREGLLPRRARAEQTLAEGRGDRDFLEAAIETIDAVIAFADRYAEALPDGEGLKDAMRHGAKDFLNALRMLRMLHLALWASNVYHNTVGRFDQYMWPYLKADLDRGMSHDEALELLEEFFLTFNRDSDLYTGMQQGDNGQSLMLGGCDREGSDASNDLTVLCLTASLEMRRIDPKINLRVNRDTPLEVYEYCTKLTKQGLGFPQYANDDVVIPGLVKLGYDLEDARNYTVAACWEFIIPGVAMDIPNIGAMPLAEVVREACEEGLETVKDFEAFKQRVVDVLNRKAKEITDGVKNIFIEPAPWQSVMMRDCLTTGRDISEGAKYNNYGIHGTGLANAVFNKPDVLLVVLDNGTPAMTGHQPNPGVCTSVLGEGCNHLDIESVVRGIGVTDVAKVKPFNMRGTLKTIEEMKARSGVRVIIAEEPCMLFARRTLKQNRPQVAEVATQGEEALKCLAELACPAFRRGGTAEAPVVSVDESQCSGCMVCLQVTPAIRARKRS